MNKTHDRSPSEIPPAKYRSPEYQIPGTKEAPRRGLGRIAFTLIERIRTEPTGKHAANQYFGQRHPGELGADVTFALPVVSNFTRPKHGPDKPLSASHVATMAEAMERPAVNPTPQEKGDYHDAAKDPNVLLGVRRGQREHPTDHGQMSGDINTHLGYTDTQVIPAIKKKNR